MRLVRAVVPLLLAPLCGCPSKVIAEYESTRSEALADPGPAPAVWEPDAALYLTADVVELFVEAAISRHGRITGDYEVQVPVAGTVTVTPDLVVRELTVASSPRCDDCVEVDVHLDGQAGWRLGRNGGSAPVDVKAKLDTEFATTRQPSGAFSVTARPRELREIELQIGGLGALIAPKVESSLDEWIRTEILDQTEPLQLGEVGGDDIPLRAARVHSAGSGVALVFLTESPSPTALPRIAPKLKSGWQLDVSTDSLLDLARKASFEAGPVGHDVVVEPTSLSLLPGGFRMGIRLWRPKGRGWWRDYTIEGTLGIVDDAVHLEATTVTEGDKSPGAAWAEPLAALGEGKILQTIEDAVQVTVPAGMSGAAGGLGFVAHLEGISAGSGVLRVRGALEVRDRRDSPDTPQIDKGSDGVMHRPRR